jgi:simple sugar transport system substrate-binding protein
MVCFGRPLLMTLSTLAWLCYGPLLLAAQPSQSGKGITIRFDTGGPVGGTYNTIVQNGAEQAAKDLGCTVEFLYSDWNSQRMLENFQEAMAAGPDGIVVMGHPGDTAFAPLIKEAEDLGIIVTASDTELPALTTTYAASGFGYAGVDNYARGKALIDTLEAAGLEVDYLEIPPEIDEDPTLGLPVLTTYLASHPDCRMVVADHDALTAQLEHFFRVAGVKDEVIGAGFSLSPATAKAIKSGYVDLVGDGQPYLQGYLPVLQIVLSKRFGFSGLNIDTGGGFIHQGNIDLIAPLAEQGIR